MNLRPIADPTVNYPKSFFDQDRMTEIFQFTKYFIKYNMPIIMTIIAVIVAGMVLYVIIDIFHNANRQSRDEDDEFDYY
ncbi:hypothetical protein [Paenibacillus sp. DRB1-1]|uniref:hypothetical protein n=1 Tax=Paenibacillus sp. DRB1-1 TaxID=3422309 RepID=UPI003F996C9C